MSVNLKEILKNLFSRSLQIPMHPWRTPFPLILWWRPTLLVCFWACSTLMASLMLACVFKGDEGEDVCNQCGQVQRPVRTSSSSQQQCTHKATSWGWLCSKSSILFLLTILMKYTWNSYHFHYVWVSGMKHIHIVVQPSTSGTCSSSQMETLYSLITNSPSPFSLGSGDHECSFCGYEFVYTRYLI